MSKYSVKTVETVVIVNNTTGRTDRVPLETWEAALKVVDACVERRINIDDAAYIIKAHLGGGESLEPISWAAAVIGFNQGGD